MSTKKTDAGKAKPVAPKPAPKPAPAPRAKEQPDVTAKKKAKVPSYRGVLGYLTAKHKQAVDALIEVITVCLGKVPKGTEVKVYASYNRVLKTRPDPAGKEYMDVWRVYEISTFCPGPGGGGGGCSWQRGDPVCLGICAAAEHVLETHGAKPIKERKTGEVVSDVAAEARDRFKYVFSLPPADKLRHAVYYLLWQEKKRPGVTLADALDGRMSGFYGRPVREELAAAVNTLGVDGRLKLDARLEKDQAIRPLRVFELCFVGFDEDNPKTEHLVKVVQASAELFQAWMAKNGIRDYLQEDARDLASEAATGDYQAEAQAVLRGKLGEDIDLIIGGTPANMTFTLADLSIPPDRDPAEAWKEEARRAEPDASRPDADRPDAGQPDDARRREVERIEQELELAGIADYAGHQIQPHPGSGYTLTGRDRYETVEEAMTACEADALSVSQSAGADTSDGE